MATEIATISLPVGLKQTAQDLGINISKAAAAGIVAAIAREEKIRELGL